MASVLRQSPNRWVVHLAERSDSEVDSEVTVEVHMSRALAGDLAGLESERLSGLEPNRLDMQSGDVGSAMLTILSSALAVRRVKERLSTMDQQVLMELIDDEAAAARANCP